MTKIQIKSIKIERIEGNLEDCFTITATSFDQAEQAIKLMSQTAPGFDGGYDKTDVFIEWVDGSSYQARIDLQQHMAIKNNNLMEHIKGSLSYRINQPSIPEDARITEEEYERYLNEYLV